MAAGQRGGGAVDEAPVWVPGPERIARANLTAFLERVRRTRPPGADAVHEFSSLYRWSVERPEAFWIAPKKPAPVLQPAE